MTRVIEPQDHGSKEWAGCKIKRLGYEFCGDMASLRLPAVGCEFTEILILERDVRIWRNHNAGKSIAGRKSRPQYFVLLMQTEDAVLQCLNVQRSVDFQSDRYVVGGCSRLKLIQKPNAFLRE